MTDLPGVWVVQPPTVTNGIQWPPQFYRDQSMAQAIVDEHHRVGSPSTLTFHPFRTAEDEQVLAAARALVDTMSFSWAAWPPGSPGTTTVHCDQDRAVALWYAVRGEPEPVPEHALALDTIHEKAVDRYTTEC